MRVLTLSERVRAAAGSDVDRINLADEDFVRAAALAEAVEAFQAAERAWRIAFQHGIGFDSPEYEAVVLTKARLLEVNLG